ncbi:hypothetical protein U1Q18_046939 [Sarracenia purpurea var. burkii]
MGKGSKRPLDEGALSPKTSKASKKLRKSGNKGKYSEGSSTNITEPPAPSVQPPAPFMPQEPKEKGVQFKPVNLEKHEFPKDKSPKDK